MPYKELIKTPQQALVHLFFYLGFADGELSNEEIAKIIDQLNFLGITEDLNHREEFDTVIRYKDEIDSRKEYLKFIADFFDPTCKELVIYNLFEISTSDFTNTDNELQIINDLAECWSMTEGEIIVIRKLALGRLVFKLSKFSIHHE